MCKPCGGRPCMFTNMGEGDGLSEVIAWIGRDVPFVDDDRGAPAHSA